MELKSVSILTIARICHEANRLYCQSIGDHSQPHWDDAPKWQQESAINGVEFVLGNSLLADYGPHLSHENWMKEKAEQGWVYGPEKDAEKKTHPCMVPFDELPIAQKVKDYLFSGIVCALGGFLNHLTEEEMESIRRGLAQSARGETVSMKV